MNPNNEKLNLNLDGKEYYQKMKKNLAKAGNLLYQYRPCRRDESTIYDIENIRHNVAYAQTPLNMNDPFDSKVGFSSEQIYNELIEMALDIVPLELNIKQILFYLLKFQLLGKVDELVSALNELKQTILYQRKAMHKENIPVIEFFSAYLTQVFSKFPKSLKAIFNKNAAKLFGTIVFSIESNEITEDNLKQIIGFDKQLEALKNAILEIRDEKYIPAFNKFLSTLTVSCFSASGWKNALMWSHYSNSYAGFCVEYDFTQMRDFIGFIERINYSKTRPTVSLKDLGISELQLIEKEDGTKSTDIVYSEPNLMKIIEYLTVKDDCWRYEDEWRIINVSSQPYTPFFIEMPKIKSITFGVNIDYLCKQLLLDVCLEKNIPCYELVLGNENFSIDRKPLLINELEFDFDKELHYISLLCESFSKNAEKMGVNVSKVAEMANINTFNASLLIDANKSYIDCLADSYFMKSSIIRLFDKYDNIENEVIPNEFLTGAKQLDIFIAESKKMIETQKETLVKIAISNLISLQDYRTLLKTIFQTDSLLEKICNLQWPDYISTNT